MAKHRGTVTGLALESADDMRYRGKCREMAKQLCKADPTLRLVRGHYHCPEWGAQTHWWCVKPDGTIVDPSAAQFPSKGSGKYVPLDGFVTCERCGKRLPERDAVILESRYPFCSNRCCGLWLGVDESVLA